MTVMPVVGMTTATSYYKYSGELVLQIVKLLFLLVWLLLRPLSLSIMAASMDYGNGDDGDCF